MTRTRRRVLFAITGALAGATAKGSDAAVAALLLGGLGWRLADVAESRRLRSRIERIEHALPDVIDLLTICVLAGMSIDAALRRVAGETSGPLADALTTSVRMLDVGIARDDAFDALARNAPAPSVAGLIASLRRAERYGVPVATVLAAQATEARSRRAARMRERALAAPVRMLFPLTLCFLPAFVLLAIAPSLIVALRSFRGW